jgi:hypothetical protein
LVTAQIGGKNGWIEVRTHFVIVRNATEDEGRNAALAIRTHVGTVFHKLFPEANLDKATPAMAEAHKRLEKWVSSPGR